MKIKSLAIKNIGLIENASITLDQPLIVFYGDIQQGKTTYLNAVRWCFGGSFPSDIIRRGAKEASVTLVFDNGSITREWYIGADEVTKARPIKFIRDGLPVSKPVDEIEKLLNPFLLDQNFLVNKTEKERRKYFVELFAVDTNSLDVEAHRLSGEASNLRASLAAYGDIDTTPVPSGDIQSIRERLSAIKIEDSNLKSKARVHIETEQGAFQAALSKASEENNRISAHNSTRKYRQTRIEELRTELAAQEALLAVTPERQPVAVPNAPHLDSFKQILASEPDTSALEKELAEALANEVRAQQYQANLAKAKEKNEKHDQLVANEARQRAIKAEKLARLAALSEKCGIEGLSFNENGDFVYQGSEAGMLSTSQLMDLSARLSSRYPPGFGLNLIDRGESLGTSIFKFIERARAEDKTILATVVGERPATIPENVGVFVVTGGVAK